MSLIDDIKRDRMTGTAGDWRHSPWHVEEGPDGVYTAEDWLLCTVSNGSDARRIARVPDIEAALLAADALAKEADRVCSVLRDDNGHAPVSLELVVGAYREATS